MRTTHVLQTKQHELVWMKQRLPLQYNKERDALNVCIKPFIIKPPQTQKQASRSKLCSSSCNEQYRERELCQANRKAQSTAANIRARVYEWACIFAAPRSNMQPELN